MMYVATVILRRTEKQFWRMSPRKLNALVKAHVRLNNPDESEKQEKPKMGYIDQIF